MRHTCKQVLLYSFINEVVRAEVSPKLLAKMIAVLACKVSKRKCLEVNESLFFLVKQVFGTRVGMITGIPFAFSLDYFLSVLKKSQATCGPTRFLRYLSKLKSFSQSHYTQNCL